MTMTEPTTINLRHLRAFCEVADTGGISAAAPSVQLSQPAVTQAIAKLEDTVGTALFHRTKSGMKTTEAGEIYRFRVGRGLACLRMAGRQAAAVAGGLQPELPLDQVTTAAQLRALSVVAVKGTIASAAQCLGVSQASLQRMARDLEQITGLALFSRGPDGMTLNAAGEEMARHVGLYLVELRQAQEDIEALRGTQTAALVMGTPPPSRGSILPMAINKALAAIPGLRLSVVDGSSRGLMRGLRRGDIDVLLGMMPGATGDGEFDRQPMIPDQMAVYSGAQGPATAWSAQFTPSELTRAAWILPPAGAPSRRAFDEWFIAAGVAPPVPLVETSSPLLVRALLRGSERLALLSRFDMAEDEAAGHVRALDVTVPNATCAIGLTSRKTWVPTKAQAAFLELLRDTTKTI